MTNLRDILESHSGRGPEPVPGAVGLVARGNHVEVAEAGFTDTAGRTPMSRESVFRIASVTKPVTAAAAMMLVEDGRIALKDPVEQWLPELASPSVVRTPSSPVDDVVPAARPITLADLLTSRAGYGFPSDFSLPAVEPLFSELNQGLEPRFVPPPDEWMARLSRIPLLHQPGEAWLYNTCSDILGVLVARVSGRPFDEFLAERIFEPLGMSDTGFDVPAAKRERFVSYYRRRAADGQDAGEERGRPDGSDGAEGLEGLELFDGPDGEWSTPRDFPSGAGGLVSTLDDLHAFARMLLAQGRTDSRSVLNAGSVRQMTTDQLTPSQRAESQLFLEGQGWGFGGSVDVETIDPWNVPGRYGWVGGAGTAAHIVPSTGAVTILLSQVGMDSPASPLLMRDFWRYAASV